MTSTNPENYEPDGADLDRMTRAQLPGPARAVADILDDWNYRHNGLTSSSHGVGLFLDILTEAGYHLTPTATPDGPLPAPPTE